MRPEVAADVKSAKEYCDSQYSPFAGTPIANKLAWPGKAAEITAAKMAITDVPSPSEKEALTAYIEAYQRCDDRQLSVMRSRAPEVYPIAYAAVRAETAILADLLVGNVSYGTVNKRLSEIDVRLHEEYQRARTALAAEQEQRNAAFAAAMGNLGQSMQQANPPPPAYVPPPPPAFPTQCRTVVIGNVVRTQCF